MKPSKTPPVKTRLKLPRLSGWLVVTLVLLACVWAIAPQQLPVSLYKLSLVTLAAVVGYWIDRSLFPYARPNVFLAGGHDVNPLPLLDCSDDTDSCVLQSAPDQGLMRLMSASMLRRAIIVGCAMLAMGLGA